MVEIVTFQVSSKTYCGFTYKIPLEICNSMSDDDIINEIKHSMKQFFSYPAFLNL